MNNSNALNKLIGKLHAHKNELSDASRTAKFWLQYLGYFDILKTIVLAERTGNWSLHLSTIGRMINLCAATGHIHYAKCARLYLQNMLELLTKYPWVHMHFSNGFHTVRHGDRYWAGLWTDMVIEQVLMRSLKSRGVEVDWSAGGV